MSIYKELKKYSKKNISAMHMPGHKRHNFLHNKLPYKLDITEIDGFDNLHSPNSLLKDAQQKLAKLYNSDSSFYLVNGSTSGILASIKACCSIGDKIITTRSCHKSVYHAIELLNLQAIFIPQNVSQDNIFCSINPNYLEKTLNENKDAKCVLITSPTYEGVISDIKTISNLCHKFNIPLIVDEAHGAHLFLLNKSAINHGADIVINSLHKTLPSLTQTACLHLNSKYVDKTKIQHTISIFNTSSPSYILMASIDECVDFLFKNGQKYMQKLQKNINYFLNLCKNLKFLKILDNSNNQFYDYDKTKIVILTTHANISGTELMDKLRQQKIELEMANINYALAYSTIFDTKKDLSKLYKALKTIDNSLQNSNKQIQTFDFNLNQNYQFPKSTYNISKQVDFKDSINQTCCEYVWIYPPGIPLLLPGEIISKQIYDYILYCKNCGLKINSTFGQIPGKINIIKLDKK